MQGVERSWRSWRSTCAHAVRVVMVAGTLLSWILRARSSALSSSSVWQTCKTVAKRASLLTHAQSRSPPLAAQADASDAHGSMHVRRQLQRAEALEAQLASVEAQLAAVEEALPTARAPRDSHEPTAEQADELSSLKVRKLRCKRRL